VYDVHCTFVGMYIGHTRLSESFTFNMCVYCVSEHFSPWFNDTPNISTSNKDKKKSNQTYQSDTQ